MAFCLTRVAQPLIALPQRLQLSCQFPVPCRTSTAARDHPKNPKASPPLLVGSTCRLPASYPSKSCFSPAWPATWPCTHRRIDCPTHPKSASNCQVLNSASPSCTSRHGLLQSLANAIHCSVTKSKRGVIYGALAQMGHMLNWMLNAKGIITFINPRPSTALKDTSV